MTKKSLGQHWLEDSKTLESICDEALVHRHDNILEIGPGPGTLTKILLSRGAQVIAVELDDQLAEELKTSIDSPHLTVINQDILKFDLTKLPKNYKVVANIPYYLTSKLIRNLSESANPPKQITMLVQKEVAERICARPGDMSLLAICAQIYYDCALGPVVKAVMFTPPPKVDSQVVSMIGILDKPYQYVDMTLLFRIAKAGFGSRRKTLINSLSGSLNIPKSKTEKLLQQCGVSPVDRPQNLSIDDWVKITQHLT